MEIVANAVEGGLCEVFVEDETVEQVYARIDAHHLSGSQPGATGYAIRPQHVSSGGAVIG